MAHLPTYSPTAILIGGVIFVVLLVGVLIAVKLRRPRPRRRKRPRR